MIRAQSGNMKKSSNVSGCGEATCKPKIIMKQNNLFLKYLSPAVVKIDLTCVLSI